MGETIDTIKFVLRKKKYLFLSLISAIVIFFVLYYFMLATVAKNSLWIAVSMSGAGYITETLGSIFLISALSGIYLSLIIFRFSLYRGISGKGIFGNLFGFVGYGIGAFGVGCPTCGAFLFGLVGVPFTLMYLPFKGTELRLLGIFVLALSVHFTAKSIRGKCEIKKK